MIQRIGANLNISFGEELSGKKIFLTGHSGFTGSWASIWLELIGAKVFGYSLDPETTPNLYSEARVVDLVEGRFADIRDFSTLRQAMAHFKPELVLHLAAQPLVRRSYRVPRETFDINAQGTANVLEAARGIESVKGVLCITTDKVYKNIETDHKYVESDELGGMDPYSASKAAAEFVISSYRDSFGSSGKNSPVISVARGGNIVGGGDWSEDRLVPDFIRAFESGNPLEIRFPQATRPWQHVISLVEGYIKILAGIVGPDPQKYNRAFNLGPIESDSVSVTQVLEQLSIQVPNVNIIEHKSDLREAAKLGLNSDLAVQTFGWGPRWTTCEVISQTAAWYKDYLSGKTSAYQLCVDQINSWNNSASGG